MRYNDLGILSCGANVRQQELVPLELTRKSEEGCAEHSAPQDEPLAKYAGSYALWQAPKAEPEPPPVQKPDIAVKAPQKPKPKPEPKPAPKKDVEFQKRLNEQLAQEQRAIDEQRREAERREAAARQQAIAAAARDRALATWVDKIRAKIRGNIRLPSDMSGNPEAIFDVTQLPTGEVISIRLRKSSGHKGYDDAVERAILKSSPLPKPDQPNLFERQLELRFRPQDQ